MNDPDQWVPNPWGFKGEDYVKADGTIDWFKVVDIDSHWCDDNWDYEHKDHPEMEEAYAEYFYVTCELCRKIVYDDLSGIWEADKAREAHIEFHRNKIGFVLEIETDGNTRTPS